MPADVGAALRFKPCLGRMRVGHGFGGGEGFRRDQKQRALRFAMRQHTGQFLPIDVGDEMHAPGWRGEFRQRQRHHLRPQVRAADADVDDIGDRSIRAHLLGVGEHGAACIFDLAQFVCYVFSSCLRTFFLG